MFWPYLLNFSDFIKFFFEKPLEPFPTVSYFLPFDEFNFFWKRMYTLKGGVEEDVYLEGRSGGGCIP